MSNWPDSNRRCQGNECEEAQGCSEGGRSIGVGDADKWTTTRVSPVVEVSGLTLLGAEAKDQIGRSAVSTNREMQSCNLEKRESETRETRKKLEQTAANPVIESQARCVFQKFPTLWITAK